MLLDTIDLLHTRNNYCLPEQNFTCVSASKQLVWRLFISILEDCRPYQEIDELGLLEFILLVLIAQHCIDFRFTPYVMSLIKKTAVLAQYNDTRHDRAYYRDFPEASSTPINGLSPYHTAISLALHNIMMMANDRSMLGRLYSIGKLTDRSESDEEYFEPFMRINEPLIPNIQITEDVILASYDHHCKPSIILYYQACDNLTMTTRDISSYIWHISSSYNIRTHDKLNTDK